MMVDLPDDLLAYVSTLAPLTAVDFEQPPENPYQWFALWFTQAQASELNDPNAMSLATVDEAGHPNVRIVLLKGLDPEGFTFYTNFNSQKGRELLRGQSAALNFHWKSARRQVRVRGRVAVVDDTEADAYFASRPRQSQLGAWASQQSQSIATRRDLEQALETITQRYEGQADVPRPPHWSGFRLLPDEIEFWQDGAFRLHDRICYSRAASGGSGDKSSSASGGTSGGWTSTRLFP